MYTLKFYMPLINSDTGKMLLKTVQSELTKHFGGTTSYMCEGTWLNSFNVLCWEKTAAIEVVLPGQRYLDSYVHAVVKPLAERVCKELAQESVLYTLGHSETANAFFVEAKEV